MPFEMDSTISIHAPPARGGDHHVHLVSGGCVKFQSTPPRGGRRTGDAHANRDV